MPVRDWTRVSAGTFHDFHGGWIIELRHALNAGLLPRPYYAQTEQFLGPMNPDVLTLQAPDPTRPAHAEGPPGATALAEAPPRVSLTVQAEPPLYTRAQRSLVIRQGSGHRVVALLEIVSPGNKSNRTALRTLVDKAAGALAQGCHLLVIDLLPPGPRDPNGIHGAVWSEICDDSYRQPADRPLTLASYVAGLPVTAYVEPVAVGQPLPDMPLFLEPEWYVSVPLERTCEAAFRGVPWPWRELLDSPSA